MSDLAGALERTRARLAAAGVESAALDARLLLEHALALKSFAALTVGRERVLDEAETARFEALVARRCRREPLAHILGEREFWSLPFEVSAATLVPRPDSETLVETALSLTDERRAVTVLDLGTGSGCLLLSFLHERARATGVGVDCSEKALSVARGNARRLGLSDRAAFVRAHWTDGIARRFDVVLCNPPYIPDGEIDRLMPEVFRYEPRAALSGGGDGLESYRAVAPALHRVLAPDGVALFEFGAEQAPAVAEILAGSGLQVIEIKDDLSSRPRCAVVRATAAKNVNAASAGTKKRVGIPVNPD